MSAFIILVEETENYKLTIAMKWLNRVTDFIPLKNTAFINHPARPKDDEYEFVDYEMAARAKRQWETFLDSYLIKKD